MTEPDPNHMVEYCDDILPKILIDVCGVDADLAHNIAADVMNRAEALATMPPRAQDILIAPFVEEVFDHKPLGTSLDLKAKVTLVVRNSILENAHHDGPVDSGIVSITEYATGPLSHFLAARRRNPIDYRGPNPFIDLQQRYPRAWASLDAITDAFTDGGRSPLRLPAAPIPDLPRADEIISAPTSDNDDNSIIFSAIDPRFDDRLITMLTQAAETGMVLVTSALSRYSRNSEKLHRILEYLLAHGATVLTTNYLIRPTDVWVRRGDPVKPDSRNPYEALTNTRGLAGTHRKIAETAARQFAT